MKKWLLTVAIVTALSACSTGNESKQQAGDTYQKPKWSACSKNKTLATPWKAINY